MRTFASLFSGGGGADIGAIAAGLKPVWGVELKPEIAEWYAVNIGHPAIVGDVCGVDFNKLESPFWLHMSPPCVTASTANAGKSESLTDLATAQAAGRAIRALMPKWVSLENVPAYGSYVSFERIKNTLERCGYMVVTGILNAANFGVPQTRRRLFLIAGRGTVPNLPQPTHLERGEERQLGMFESEPLREWRGWYEAVEDLIPSFDSDNLSAWQLDSLSEPLPRPCLVPTDKFGWEVFRVRQQADPAQETTPHIRPRAILLNGENSTSKTRRTGEQPAMTIRAGTGSKSHLRALLDDSCVVRLTPRALARLQSFPDPYALPDDRRLAGRIIGNAVPPLLMQRVIEANL